MARGNVYVFNNYVEEVHNFNVNGADVGNVAAWLTQSNGKTKYTPGALTVARIRKGEEPDTPGFEPGPNAVAITWPSFYKKAKINIPSLDQATIETDMVLLLTNTTLVLINGATGRVLEVVDIKSTENTSAMA
jgi:hypothetical protein